MNKDKQTIKKLFEAKGSDKKCFLCDAPVTQIEMDEIEQAQDRFAASKDKSDQYAFVDYIDTFANVKGGPDLFYIPKRGGPETVVLCPKHHNQVVKGAYDSLKSRSYPRPGTVSFDDEPQNRHEVPQEFLVGEAVKPKSPDKKDEIKEQASSIKDELAKMIIDYLKDQQGTTEESGNATAQAIINLTWSGGVTMDQAARIMANPASASTTEWNIQDTGIWSSMGDGVASWVDEYTYLRTGGVDLAVLLLAAGLTQL